MKRLGIFCCYDVNGVVDDYVYYLLNDINENLDELYIVSNASLSKESIYKLSKITDNDIIFRDNVGFDARAWREAMFNIGFITLSKFDEVILFNDSFFGPIYPFKEMFDKMENEDVDFWGITEHGEAPNLKNLCPYGYRPRHLQSYFLVFRKNLLESDEFRNYWLNLPQFKNREELTFKFEAVLTKHFEDLEYKWKAYVDSEDL